jgi:hypothetical protein
MTDAVPLAAPQVVEVELVWREMAEGSVIVIFTKLKQPFASVIRTV